MIEVYKKGKSLQDNRKMSRIKGYPKIFLTKKDRQVTIRLPKKDDLDELLRYINELVDEDTTIMMNEKVSKKEEKEYLEGVLKAIRNKEGFSLLAFYKGKLVANVSVERRKYRQSHLGSLGISVRKDFRDEGLGTELIRQAIVLSKDFLKLKLLVLNVFAVNKKAIYLYERMGFKKCGKWPKGVLYQGKYIDDTLMYLNLGI